MAVFIAIVLSYVFMLVTGLLFLISYAKNRAMKQYFHFGVLLITMGLCSFSISHLFVHITPAWTAVFYRCTLTATFFIMPLVLKVTAELLTLDMRLRRIAEVSTAAALVFALVLAAVLWSTTHFAEISVQGAGIRVHSGFFLYLFIAVSSISGAISAILLFAHGIRYRTAVHRPFGAPFLAVFTAAVLFHVIHYFIPSLRDILAPAAVDTGARASLNVLRIAGYDLMTAGFLGLFFKRTKRIFHEVQENRASIEGLLTKTRENTRNMIHTLSKALSQRDPVTAAHCERVADYAAILARELGYPKSGIDLVYTGALMHDIGKIGISDAVLHKKAKLTREEFDLIRRHPLIGTEIIAHLDDFVPIIDVIQSHHERIDAHGYPEGLAADAIPEMARIVSVCDTFDALTTETYREPLTYAEALRVLLHCRGTQLDVHITDVFVRAIAEVHRIDIYGGESNV